jgi:hypothetical protein
MSKEDFGANVQIIEFLTTARMCHLLSGLMWPEHAIA